MFLNKSAGISPVRFIQFLYIPFTLSSFVASTKKFSLIGSVILVQFKNIFSVLIKPLNPVDSGISPFKFLQCANPILLKPNWPQYFIESRLVTNV